MSTLQIFVTTGFHFSNETGQEDVCSGDETSDEAYYSAIILGFFRFLGKHLAPFCHFKQMFFFTHPPVALLEFQYRHVCLYPSLVEFDYTLF